MADLKPFRDLLEQADALEIGVTNLKKERDDLVSEKIILTASNKHARDSIDNLRKEAEETRQNNEKEAELQKTTHSKALQDLDIVKADIKTNQTILSQLNTSINVKREEYDRLVTQYTDEVAKFGVIIHELEDKRVDIESEIDKLNLQMVTLGDSIPVLEEKLNSRKISLESELKQCDESYLGARLKLQKINVEIESRQNELEDLVSTEELVKDNTENARKQHDEFMEYEKKAQKVLEAREQSILDKEEQLNITTIQSNRRNRILDKID